MPTASPSSFHEPMRLPEVMERTKLKKTDIYRRMKRGSFPKPAKLSHKVAVWSRVQVEQWCNSLFDQTIEDLLG